LAHKSTLTCREIGGAHKCAIDCCVPQLLGWLIFVLLERERERLCSYACSFHTCLLFFAKGNCACSIYPFFILLSFWTMCTIQVHKTKGFALCCYFANKNIHTLCFMFLPMHDTLYFWYGQKSVRTVFMWIQAAFLALQSLAWPCSGRLTYKLCVKEEYRWGISNFTFSFSILSIITGIPTLFNTRLTSGGIVTMVFVDGWLITHFFKQCLWVCQWQRFVLHSQLSSGL